MLSWVIVDNLLGELIVSTNGAERGTRKGYAVYITIKISVVGTLYKIHQVAISATGAYGQTGRND